MKKLCLLLALVLVLTAIPAYAAEGDAYLGQDDDALYFNGMYAQGDIAYMFTYDNCVYSYKLGDAELAAYQIQIPVRDSGASDDLILFGMDDKLYAIDLVSLYGEDDTEFLGAELYELTLVDAEEDASATMNKVLDLDWDDLVEYYGQSAYPSRPEAIVAVSGAALMYIYDETGTYQIYRLDMATGKIRRIDELHDASMMTRYRDGQVLVETYSYETPDTARLYAYDVQSEALEQLVEVEIPDYTPLNGLAYDAGTDTLYCVKSGEICPVDLRTGEVGEGLTNMPAELNMNSTAYVLDGGYYAAASHGLTVRNLDPAQKADIRLKISDMSYSDCVLKAYQLFDNAHGDVETVLSREWSEQENLLENMMNRDDSIDVYITQANSTDFEALYNRGFLMEMDGSVALTAFTKRMYPNLLDGLSINGRLVALPVEMNSWTVGINEQALEALGYTLADVPDNWSDFLDFLAGLAQPLAEHPGVHFWYGGFSDKDVRNALFNALFEDYQRYVNLTDPTMGYNTELLRGLLTKLEGIDFVALGCEEASEDEADEGMNTGYADYSDDSILIEMSVGCSIGNFYGNFTPVLLKLDADTPAYLALASTVAFINPYTKHPDEALAFIETLADCLPNATLYCLDPNLNEPIRGKVNEESLEEAREAVASLQADLDAADEADRQMLEEEMRDLQENLTYWETYGWDVSQREIEWYRAHGDHLAIAKADWLYADESGEAWELIYQYNEGHIGMDEMLSGIDRKVQMMLMEGN